MSSEGEERLRHVRIKDGQIACRSCRCWTAEVVLLKPDRPLCLGCAGEQVGVSVETIREWLRAGKVRGVTAGG